MDHNSQDDENGGIAEQVRKALSVQIPNELFVVEDIVDISNINGGFVAVDADWVQTGSSRWDIAAGYTTSDGPLEGFYLVPVISCMGLEKNEIAATVMQQAMATGKRRYFVKDLSSVQKHPYFLDAFPETGAILFSEYRTSSFEAILQNAGEEERRLKERVEIAADRFSKIRGKY